MTYTTFFATQFTVPTTRSATDREVFAGVSKEPIKDFGIGEPCLYELVQGTHLLQLQIFKKKKNIFF